MLNIFSNSEIPDSGGMRKEDFSLIKEETI